MNIPSLRYIDVDAGRLAYRRSGDGPPLLLIHGWGGSSRHWLGAYVTLVRHHTVYALDLPGFGESPPRRDGGGLDRLVESTLAFIDAVGIKRYGVAGHSLGGAVALLVAAARFEAVERLALVAFGLPRSPEEGAHYAVLGAQMGALTALLAPWLTFSRPWLMLSRPWRQLAWTTPPWPALLSAPLLHSLPEPAALALGVADLIAMDALAALEGASTQGDPQMSHAATRVTMPTLVLGGRQDPIFPPSSAATLAAALPNSQLTLIDGCGHVPMAEQPMACYGALEKFFTDA